MVQAMVAVVTAVFSGVLASVLTAYLASGQVKRSADQHFGALVQRVTALETDMSHVIEDKNRLWAKVSKLAESVANLRGRMKLNGNGESEA